MANGKDYSSRYGGGTHYYIDNRLNPCFRDKVDLACEIAGKAAVDCIFGTFDDISLREISSFYSNLVGLCCKKGAYGLHFIAAEQSENETARMQCDCLVAYEAERIYRQVKNAINKNREFLEKIVSALREKLILSAEDIKNIRDSCTLVPFAV